MSDKKKEEDDVVTDLNGNYILQIGSTGEEGLRDGSFDDATFNRPQGLAYNAKKNLLYVADTENHALREIDFVNETVQTLAGNGTKGSDYQGGRKRGKLSKIEEHKLYGFLFNSTSTSFAQPSGISLSPDLKEVYIADSESSSIRALDLKTGGSRLLAGGDTVFSDNLFRFGDHDGVGSEVLLQHPLGVSCGKDGQIYVADSYNHKIKKLDPATGRVSTLAGTGKAGFKDGRALAAQLSEPSGIVEVENGVLFIADTNNSVIRYLDLKKKEADLVTLELKGVQPPIPKSRSLKRLRRRSSADTQTITADGTSSNEGNLYIRISVPEGYHFSKEAQSKFSIETEPETTMVIAPLDGILSPGGFATLHFRRSSPSAFMARVNCKVYYCKEDEVCLYQSVAFEVPFRDAIPGSSPADISLDYAVKPKTPTNSLLAVAR
ncbi:Protein suppressor of QUENCHING 1, chloroplastic [Vitis vinifera]|uniref:Protein suppressor of QUENCHING 1, chloroplastic n=1 Tax=Vitis vinifera TaxID=29760 RepID=A0A438IM99_VITVI|nr:Protein suppressor of QUENCHING 1, chloroplastic [Vitis vinifera]